MAKQSGLHQIRGKVGEHSYYTQTGVIGGLIRQINQGMSEKVKTAAAFANTRLNNAEFGYAGRLAAMLGLYIEPKYRPMILPFSQSKMAKQILEIVKNDSTSPWGQRVVTDSDGSKLAPILSSVAKNNFDDWGLVFGAPVALGEDQSIDGGPQFESKLAAIGADGVYIKVVMINTAVGKYNELTNKYNESYARGAVAMDQAFTEAFNEDFAVQWPADFTAQEAWSNNHMVAVIVLPYRTVGGRQYTLQEHCTFKVFEQAAVQTLS